MIGKMYEARKKSQGGDRGTAVDPETGRFTANGQNVHLRERRETRDGTSGEIGKDFGIDGKTVRRNEKFAKGVDAIREVSPAAISTSTVSSGQRYTRKRMTLRRKRKAGIGEISTRKWQSSNPNLAKQRTNPVPVPEKQQQSLQTSLALTRRRRLTQRGLFLPCGYSWG